MVNTFITNVLCSRASPKVMPFTKNHPAQRSFRSKRTFADIPEHVKNHIETLYFAMQRHLGDTERLRKRCFVSMLKVYYKWESTETLSKYFDMILKNFECLYLMEQRSKSVERSYSTQVMQLFGAVDIDGNSSIDLNEFKNAVQCLEVDVDWSKMFYDADKDHNGSLDVLEFYNLVANTPVLYTNFETILEHTREENDRKNRRKRSRLFSYDDMHTRPCLKNLRKRSEILSSDVPMYDVRISRRSCDAYLRYYGQR
jgi:Ca2+-binding EF-hand superfamily protein